MRRFSTVWWVVVGLAALTFAAYRHAGGLGFVNLDDDAYVEFAPMVNKGLRMATVVWAWTGIHTANWHPLTTLSHTLDCDLFGVRPGPMHWENVAWHVLNTVVLFGLLRAYTGALWRPAFVAALFALHPLHVESVAWISSRKDLLCALFWFLGLWAYLRWTQWRLRRRYALIALCLAVALLFKPMAVTFPFTLLLLDAWPLRRWPAQSWGSLLVEKLPLFGVGALHSAITFIVQHAAGAAHYAERFPLTARLGNAMVAYMRYLGKTFWPETLSPLYWHPGYWPFWAVAGAVAFIAAVTYAAWRRRDAAPWFIVGWCWFVGTLIPVIGIVQVGAQSMADRYTYVPLIGVFIVLAWAAGAFVGVNPRYRPLLVGTGVALLAACFVLTQRQVLAWRDSITLYERSIRAGEDNAAVRYLLATALAAAGRPETEAVAHYQRAIDRQPDYVNAHTQLAIIAMRHRQADNARAILEKNVAFEPRNSALHVNLGSYWVIHGDLERAMKHFQDALRIAPSAPGVHREIAQLHVRHNRLSDARAHYALAVESDPWNASDLTQLGLISGNLGQLDVARRHLARAVWIDPDNRLARRNLLALERAERLQAR